MTLSLFNQREYDKIAKTYMTPEDAFEYLNNGINILDFSKILNELIERKSDKKSFIKSLYRFYTDLSYDSLSKKVRGWLAGKYEPTDRETYFRICFALNLNLSEAQEFLTLTSDSNIHFRNPRELTYAFALKNNLDYFEALDLYTSLPPIPETDTENTVYTETIYDEFIRTDTVDEFKEFYNNNIYNFGVLHNTAYRYLTEFVNVLTEPDEDIEDLIEDINEEKYSIEKIVNDYLRMNVPSKIKSSEMTYIQKIIKKYWPSATSVKNMLNRSEDVKRKIIMLLYLITEGIIDDAPYNFLYDDELTPEESFGEHYRRICLILSECGYAMLNLNNPFDWIVLYAIKMSNTDVMADEMQAILNKIFNGDTSDEDI